MTSFKVFFLILQNKKDLTAEKISTLCANFVFTVLYKEYEMSIILVNKTITFTNYEQSP